MERSQVVVVAASVAALALFGLRLTSVDAPQSAGSSAAAVFGPRVPAPLNRRPPRISNPWGDPGEHETHESGGGDPADAPADEGDSPRGGARRLRADVIAGLPRERAPLVDTIADVGPAVGGEISLDGSGLIAGGRGLVPGQAGGHGVEFPEGNPNKRQVFEFVDDDPAGGDDGPLLSIPFDGDVTPEAGGEPTHAEGLVVDGGAIEFTEDAIVTFPADGHVNGRAGTISFEIEPDWSGADDTNNSLVQIRNEHVWENRLQIVKNFDSLRFIFIDNSGQERNVNVYIDDWQAGEPHRVAATWGDATMALYVDGRSVGQNTYPGQFEIPPSTPIFIGSDFPGAAYAGAGGRIRDFRIWGRALGPDELSR